MTPGAKTTGFSTPGIVEASKLPTVQEPSLDASRPAKRKCVLGVRRRLAAAAQQQQLAAPHESTPRPRAKFLDLRPDSPFRPPTRRWQIALLLNETADVPPEWVDRWTLLAEELLTTDLKRAGNPPDLVAAAEARELYEEGPCSQQVEVEARLLAGEAVEAIAMKTGLTEATVEAYEALFYAVKDRLQQSSYVVNQVINIHSEKAEQDVGVQIRLLGFTGGPVALDAVLDAVRSEAGEGDTGEVSEEVRQRRKWCLLTLKLRMMPLTDRNRMRWFRIYALQRELKLRRW